MVSEWRKTTVGEFAPFFYGKGLTESQRDPEGKVPVFGSNGIVGFHREALVPRPAVIIGRKGTVGAVHHSPMPCWPIDTTFYVFDEDPELLRFKYYLLKSLGLDRMNADSAVPGLNRDAAHARAIRVPPLDEQREIAHILGTLDDKIELNRRMNATLEAIARAIFKSWFVDFDPVRAKMRGEQPAGMDAATAALFPDAFEDSELGPIPVGWGVERLDDVLNVLEVGDRPRGGVADITEGIPSIGAESIVGLGVFDYSKTKYISNEYAANMKRGHVVDRDVLLYKDGGRPGIFIPHVAMFGDGFPFESMTINSHVYRLRAKVPLSQEFLFFWLSSPYIMHEMHLLGGGAAIPGINSAAVRSLPMVVPPPDICQRFYNIISPLVSRVFSNGKESRTLATLRDAVLPKLISGTLRIEIAKKFEEGGL